MTLKEETAGISTVFIDGRQDQRQHPFLKTADAIRLATAFATGAKAFLTNDGKLAQFDGLRILVLKDYL